ncbi:RING finger protein 160 [Gryllus bimaculatus]|nr:RING finger protein 160 [Gryllus bimaculatus]
MGGKQKAQRTKGNVKPSSSGRSAALLSTSTFTGFSGLKDSMFPSFQPASISEEIDATIDPNFQLVLKKMNKKDPTTRVKALQEFIKLVESSDAEVLKAVLPFWPRLYCLLVGDVEHRVREAANDAQRSVIVQAKRNMAPYLRSVAGPWFVAQFDTYPPAASAAVRAFQEAFPPNKLLEVIAFCQEEILKYISDNLLDQTDVKQDNSGRTEKQERVIITSLQGFCHYLMTVQDDLLTNPTFVQISDNLLQSQQFWKFGIDKVPLVRSSWLSVITAILEKVPHLLKDHHQLLVKRILGRLDETDAVVIPYVWQSALSILVKLEDWSSYCDVNKQVFPRLWNILREGGYGCAATIFPNMLPLLNALLETKELKADKEVIVDTFFKSMREGFEKKSIQNSKSESDAAAQCYMECIRFVVKCGIEDSKLVLEHLMPVMEMTLTESSLRVLSKGIYEHVSRLLHYWCSEKCMSQYETVCKCFWDSSLQIFQKVLLQAENDSAKVYILNQEVQFCSNLKNPNKFRNKNVHKVRFSTEEDTCVTSVSEKKFDGEELLESESFSKHLNKFIMSLSLMYLKRINEQNDLCCVIPLAKLLSEHNSHELIEHLVLNCNVSDLFKTLSKKCFVTSGQNNEIVVELACSMIQHLEPAEREEILNTMCQEPDVLVCIFRVAQKEKVKPYILQWLRASFVNDQLIKLSQELCSANYSSNIKEVLMECTVSASNGDFLVDMGTISSVMYELCNASCNSEMAIFAAQFLKSFQVSLSKIEDLQSLIQVEDLAKSIYKLVVVLFRLCCDKENTSGSIKDLLCNGWQSGVNILSRIKATDVALLVTELSGIVRKNLLCSDILMIEDIDHIVEISLKLLNAAELDDVEVFSLFTNGVLSTFELMEHSLTVHCENILMVLGGPVCNLKVEHLLTSETIFQYVLLSLFTSKIITKIVASERTLIEEKENSSVDPHFDVESNIMSLNNLAESQNEVKEMLPFVNDCKSIVHKPIFDKIELFDFVSQRILQLALAVSLCEMYSIFFKNMSFYNKTKMFINDLQNTFVNIKSKLSKSGKISSIKESALEKASHLGGLWVQTAYLLSEKDEWLTIHKTLSCGNYSGYSAKVLFKKALEVSMEIPVENLGCSPGIVEITYWLKYMKGVPDKTILPLILSFITKWRDTDRKELLYDCDISTQPFTNKYPHIMEQHIWDFIIVSAAYYAQNLKHIQKFYFSEEMDNLLNVQSLECEKLRNVFVFSFATFDLLNAITQFCQNVKKKEDSEVANFEDYVNEWKNVFGEEVHIILTNIFVSASGYPDKTKPSFLGHLFLQKYCSLMINVNEESVAVEDTSKKVERTILMACCKLLHSPVSSLQLTAYHIFKKNLIYLINNDANGLSNNQGMEESTPEQFEIYPLLNALQDTQTVVDTMLTEFSIGDSCIIQPHTDSYYYTAAYLLLWNLVLHACDLANSELRYQYATLLRNEGFLPSLLNNLFILMPSEVLETQPKAKTTALGNMFGEAPQLSLGTECTSQQLQHMACWIYCWAVSRLPALVRQWWSDTRAKASAIVLKTTVQYVTPLLCTRDLQAIQNQNTKWKNMEVKVHSKARQVVAVYSVDESQMELIITLPEEYPLATIQVDTHTSSLVGTSHWRYWVKQLSIFLTHQNGSLWDGLVLWKSNLDKRFEGVEECYICFSVLHGTNFQIPKLCCKTCKKKFHSPCLYKWFSTSNKSTCPICRNMF